MLNHSREKKDLMNITKLNTLSKLAERVVNDFMQFFCLHKKQSPKGCINHICNFRRRRKVLKFKDCSNFEVPYNTVHIEDFIYLEGKKDMRSWVNGALNKAAADAYEQSNFSISLPDFQLSLNLSFILNIPKSLVMSVITPKMFLPFVIIYKQFVVSAKNALTDVKTIMKKLKNIFTCLIRELFWKFLREFWKKIKADLKNFLLKIVEKILRDKLKRYYLVIKALINLLRRVIEEGINNCEDLIQLIVNRA